ncbi:Haloacid dehalogenase-like hydrolase [Candidatus Tiddalikarchaeum anstoanum]|nr:Haloacid dehalogenase-like hydrolase [Candidatus Tiddalikarchaeum anstoanum]
MIKVIITDLGGVYFKKGTNIFLEKIEKKLKVKKDVLNDLFKSSGTNGNLYRKGRISKEEFWSKVLEKTGLTKDKIPMLEKLWFSSYTLNNGMKSLMAKLRKNYRVIVFSGNIKERMAYLDKKYNLKEQFDDFILSFDYGYNKNEPELYKILAKKAGAKPDECVVIDDKQEVLNMAAKIGFNTILFEDAKKLKKSLEKIGVKINNNVFK